MHHTNLLIIPVPNQLIEFNNRKFIASNSTTPTATCTHEGDPSKAVRAQIPRPTAKPFLIFLLCAFIHFFSHPRARIDKYLSRIFRWIFPPWRGRKNPHGLAHEELFHSPLSIFAAHGHRASVPQGRAVRAPEKRQLVNSRSSEARELNKKWWRRRRASRKHKNSNRKQWG